VLTDRTTPDDDPRRRTDGAATTPAVPTEPAPSAVAGLFVSSPRGARLARRCAVRGLAGWGFPAGGDTSGTVALLVAELVTNAVRHGRSRDHDRYHLRLAYDVPARTIRIEVSDANPRHPPAGPAAPGPDDESGRGLLLVGLLATRWGTAPRDPLGKTVWAEVAAEVAADAGAAERRPS
jgi:anti-sigma regulatory factor (Ser/Thr protein kinase)